MQWKDIRQSFPETWLLIEALKAHSQSGERILDDIAVIDSFYDASTALKTYRQHHHDAPARELYVVHTDKQDLNIKESIWLGIRGTNNV